MRKRRQEPQCRVDLTPLLHRVYGDLASRYGPRQWWPAETRFEILVGAILTQNTSWNNVEHALRNLKRARALDPERILSVDAGSLAALLRPAGYYNVKARRLRNLCRWLQRQGGLDGLHAMPTEALRASLLAVHGVGPETADDILLYAMRRRVFIVDAYTRRIFSRIGAIAGDEDYEALRRLFECALPDNSTDYGEFHALIVAHGKATCRPKPLCDQCCLNRLCSFPRA